jgi:threonine aldolase
MMAAATGIPGRDYAALFDSVYVSLWKYLGAPFGAILAGGAELIDGLYHERRMFGGGLPSSALAAALALDGLPGFAERFAAALEKARSLFDALNGLTGLAIERFPDGSNIFPLHLGADIDPAGFIARLADQGIVVPAATGDTLQLTVNTTVLRRSNEEIVSCFRRALTRPV